MQLFFRRRSRIYKEKREAEGKKRARKQNGNGFRRRPKPKNVEQTTSSCNDRRKSGRTSVLPKKAAGQSSTSLRPRKWFEINLSGYQCIAQDIFWNIVRPKKTPSQTHYSYGYLMDGLNKVNETNDNGGRLYLKTIKMYLLSYGTHIFVRA